jgi:uncharacterized surface protein with fasciclin (FAS1) repeats
MKKLTLLLCLILNSSILLAQSDTEASKKPDSTFLSKPKKISKGDLKIIDGTSMIAANDIAANITRSKELSRFLNFIQLTSFSETLKSKGPLTIFVPDDVAFTKISAGKLDTLLQTEHKYDLIALVGYHVLAGKITASNIAHKISSGKGTALFTTLTGSILTAKIDENRNIVLIDENGGRCTVKRFDIQQNNGLIHIVNAVLVPKFKLI